MCLERVWRDLYQVIAKLNPVTLQLLNGLSVKRLGVFPTSNLLES